MLGSRIHLRWARVALLLPLIVATTSAPGVAQSAGDTLAIVGSWTATIRSEGQPDARALYSFSADGIATAVPGSTTLSNALGGWQATGDSRFAATLEGHVFDGAGTRVGSFTLTETVTVDGRGDSFDAVGTLLVLDVAGAEVSSAEITVAGSRIGAVTEVVEPIVITASGSRVADLRRSIREYKLLLGGEDNQGEPGPFPSGFRTIVWDFTPDGQTAPNFMDRDLFNGAAVPRARGAVFGDLDGDLMVSAEPGNSAGVLPLFGNINPTYVDTFAAFSKERVFSPVGTNVAELEFFVPGTDIPAVVSGFGAVYVDVDTPHTAFEYFDIDGEPLGSFDTPIANNGFSFLGVKFPEPIVHKVRITYGTVALGPDDSAENDVAVMDDFFYGEPQAAG